MKMLLQLVYCTQITSVCRFRGKNIKCTMFLPRLMLPGIYEPNDLQTKHYLNDTWAHWFMPTCWSIEQVAASSRKPLWHSTGRLKVSRTHESCCRCQRRRWRASSDARGSLSLTSGGGQPPPGSQSICWWAGPRRPQHFCVWSDHIGEGWILVLASCCSLRELLVKWASTKHQVL